MARSLRTMAEPTTENMSAEEEIRSFFKHLEPAMDSGDTSVNPEARQGEERKNKWPREQNKGQNVGKGNIYRSGRQSWTAGKARGVIETPKPSKKELEYVKDNKTLMARSILRHEDELSQQRTEREFLLTLEQGSAGLLPIMYRQSMEWKKKDSTGVNGPLRLHLFNSIMQSWKQRVETVHNSEPAKAGALLMGIAKEEPAGNLLWNYRKWDWDKADLVADEREPLTHMQAMEHLSSILQSCEALRAVLKFHSTRPLAHWTPVTFLLSIGNREPKCLILYRADGHVRQWLVESHQHESQASEDGKAAFAQNLGREVSSQGMGGRGQKEERRHRLRAPVMVLRPMGTVLTNPHNICHANSVFQLMIWTVQTSGLKPDFCDGALCLAFQQIPLHRRVYVPDIPHWSRVLRGWPHLNRQQDCVEFLMFVLREARPSAYTGSWQARMLMPQQGTHCLSIVDRGSAFSILALDV